MVQAIQRVTVDVTASMMEELDQAARELTVGRQAIVKTLVRQAFDQRYVAQRARRPQRGARRRPTRKARGSPPVCRMAARRLEEAMAGWRRVIRARSRRTLPRWPFPGPSDYLR